MSRPECGDTEGKLVLCPLFRAFGSSNGQSWIRCESHVPDSNTVEIRYRNMERFKEQREIFCKGCYQRCEHYQAWLHMKWEAANN